MGLLSILLIAIGLSMDAFAVAICKGMCLKKGTWVLPLQIGLCFGFFQFIMPLVGYFLGTVVSGFTQNFAHWIAFALLGFIGFKLIMEGRKPHDDTVCEPKIPLKELLILGIATSIDALAVGVSFALLGEDCFIPSLLIGVVTFVIAFLGAFFGRKLGELLGKRAEILGGLALLAIGLKILIDGLFR